MSAAGHWSEVDYVVVDVEGNGARPPELVELAAVLVEGGRIGRPRTWLMRPPTPISWQARKIHGIRNDDVAECPRVDDVAEEICEVLGDAVPVGHNVRIDLDVLTRSLAGWKPARAIDTLRLARKAWVLPSHKLGALVAHRDLADGLPDGLTPHRAEYDALVTARLFVDLATNGPEPRTAAALFEAGGITLAGEEPEPELKLFDGIGGLP
ncbi:3'-5' exonuclease [Nocardia cyriacigeorgica]|uniref:3'-5' exonuclease n=1 Tax=Nocardia cyriacigeorgica TaxID=135487 RepID=UPI0002E5D571|nr:3'-5' exonuclease [Nocardia cyriacigeorgica]TLF59497.1 3'-5' exonuclease [Nocardia cyriacigeorgica]